MADRPNTLNGTNGLALEDDDMFEKDLKEMLADGPTLNDIGSTIQLGNAHSGDLGTGMHRNVPSSLPTNTVPRSYSSQAPVTTDIPLSSPSNRSMGSSHTPSPKSPGGSTSIQLNSKLENIKEWSINTFKCTKQLISERLGKGTRTVDLELEAQIEALRDTQRKYSNILRLARALSSHFTNVVQTQRQLGDAFGDMSQKNPELQEEFSYNAETQRVLSRNGETLLGALNFFTSSVNTLCNKTMEDTILTIKNYEAARLEFDAYKNDFDLLKNSPRDSNTIPKLEEAQKKFDAHKDKFEKLRADVSVKLRFLDENKVKVARRQLFLLHKATNQYIQGNVKEMEALVKQYNITNQQP